MVSNITSPHYSHPTLASALHDHTNGTESRGDRQKSSRNYQNRFIESPFSSHSNTTFDSGSASLSSLSGSDHHHHNGFKLLYSDDSITGGRGFDSDGLQMERISAGLRPRNALDIRLAAIKKLDSYPIGDLLSSELWAETRAAIETSLLDADVRIVMAGLRICARSFKASPPPMTAEVYLILVNHLINIFQSGNVSKIGDGLNVDDSRTSCLLRKFRLLHQFQMELPSCWLRFPDSMFKDVMDSTFKLLRPDNVNMSCLTSLYCMSLTDTNALWFEKWMISSIGRVEAVPSMVKVDFVSNLAYHFFSYISMISSADGAPKQARPSDEVVVMDVDVNDEEGDSAKNIAKHDLDYIHFLHILVILTRLLLFSDGRKCFPIRIDKDCDYFFKKAEITWDMGMKKKLKAKTNRFRRAL
ncbi:broad-minded protein-domain-containing protein [Chytridium lagenaria]|nr:broad-minded protein-domain-containing protein [Chytridium lagenaria]